ncbi:MAG: DinB family protein [Dehalococcoidia bacterium]
MDTIAPSALSTLAAMPDAFAALAAGARYRGFDGDWTPFECLAHVVDISEHAFRQRIGRVLEHDRPRIMPVDPPALLRAGGYQRYSIDELLARFRDERTQDLAWLRSLSAADLGRFGVHDEAGEVRAAEFVNYWPCHEIAHLRQAAAAVRTELLTAIGPMGMFLDDV